MTCIVSFSTECESVIMADKLESKQIYGFSIPTSQVNKINSGVNFNVSGAGRADILNYIKAMLTETAGCSDIYKTYRRAAISVCSKFGAYSIHEFSIVISAINTSSYDPIIFTSVPGRLDLFKIAKNGIVVFSPCPDKDYFDIKLLSLKARLKYSKTTLGLEAAILDSEKIIQYMSEKYPLSVSSDFDTAILSTSYQKL